MITELQQGIVTQYNTLQYDAIDLTLTCPLFADIGQNGSTGTYPFCVYSLVATTLSNQDTCSDFHTFLLSFSVFDACSGLEVISEIADVILEGFRNPSLASLDGTQIRIDPDNILRRFIPEEDIWSFTLDFMIQIEKTRA